MNSTDISKHFYFDSSDEVLREVLEIIRLISSGFNTKSVCEVFDATECLYKGNFPGYSACNTGYHDFRHAIDTFLAMARLIHGAVLAKNFFSERQIITALTAAILHDAGYIQEKSDNQGTGAKYKINHEQRSMAFLSRHGFEFGLSAEEIAACNSIILCTDMNADISAISFSSLRIELLGKMLGTADLMAQLAERRYLEKLLYLYHEYKEAADFCEFYYDRLRTPLDSVDRFMQLHFASRWGIYQDLYDEMIDRQKNYLFKILKVPHTDPREYLRRDGIVKKLREQYAKDAPANRQTSSKTPGNI